MSGCTMFSGPSLEDAIRQANSGGMLSDYKHCSKSDMSELVNWVESRSLKEKYYSNHNSFESSYKEGEVVESMFGGPMVMSGKNWSVQTEYYWGTDATPEGEPICIPAVSLVQGTVTHDMVTGRSLESYIVKN